MAKPKRFSLKGRGADIFFGDYAPPAANPAVEDETTDVGDADGQIEQASLQASPDTSKQASKLASKQASGSADAEQPAPPPEARTRRRAPRSDRTEVTRTPAATVAGVADEAGVRFAEVDEEIWERIEASATITSSFRYTESELTALTDVLYELGKQHSIRVTKQDVARLGLNVVLNDYYQRGPSSLLGQLAGRRRRRSGG